MWERTSSGVHDKGGSIAWALTNGRQIDMQKGDCGGYSRHRKPSTQAGHREVCVQACTKHLNAICEPAVMGMVRNKAGNTE